ncbi:MAG: FKBP-type peptidyl-prolyl cis-trans isomerase [Fermentimonas sp.]|jgi:FKBP-type peptidyl-prolyl cis-trans isomerase FklB
MKLRIPLFIVLCMLFSLAACDKDESKDDPWRLDNEAQFVKISANTDYTRLVSFSNRGYIMYKELEEGDGATPLFTDQVKVHYSGWYKYDWEKPDTYSDDKGNVITNKIIFDSTENRNNIPSTFSVNPNARTGVGVIDGFSTALQHMQVGDKWEVWIPWGLGYGEKGYGNSIPGYTTLVFEIKLIEIVE